MATNPFMVRPWSTQVDIPRTALGIGRLIQDRRQFEAEQAQEQAERAQEMQQQEQEQARQQEGRRAVAAAYQSGNPDEVARVMIEYPEMRKELESAIGFRNEATKRNMLASARQILANRDDPEKMAEILEARVAFVTSQGGDPAQTLGSKKDLEENQRRFLEGVENLYAFLAPQQEYQAYQARRGVGPKAEELDIKRETLQLRRDENQARLLEQRIARETNDLKREQLQLEVDQLNQKVEQGKRDVLSKAENRLGIIDAAKTSVERMLNHPGLEAAVGKSSAWPTAPGSAAADFEELFKTYQDQAFVKEVSRMKGTGPVTDAEGARLSSLDGPLALRMQEKTFRESLQNILSVLERSSQRAMTQRNQAFREIAPQEETPATAVETTEVQTTAPAAPALSPPQQQGRFTVRIVQPQ